MGTRMELSRTALITRYSNEELLSTTNLSHLLFKMTKQVQKTNLKLKLEFVKKSGVPNHVKNLEYIECYSHLE